MTERFQNLKDKFGIIAWGFVLLISFLSILELMITLFLIMTIIYFTMGFLFDWTSLSIISCCVYVCIFYFNLVNSKLEDF